MPLHVCNGATLMCSFGVAPGPFTVLPINRKTTTEQPSGTIMDNKPIENIPSFGMCLTPTNPEVASATAAALGVLTPMPCVPATGTTPWTPGSPNVTLGDIPTIEQTDILMCMWLGVISVVQPGQVKQTIP